MRGKSLLNDISMQELSTMRENGMTNREIAEKLDVAYSCIHRLLGPRPDGMRAKPRRKEKPLPTLPEKLVEVDQPHKSFAQRCEEILKRTDNVVEAVREHHEEVKKMFEPGSAPVGEDVVSPAAVAREAHVKAIERINAPYTTYKEERSHIPELIAMFGRDAVIAWLKVSLYDMGIPDCRPMKRERMLDALKILNGEVRPA